MAQYTPIYQLLDYDQGEDGGDMDFVALWKNAPAGSMVSFHAMTDPAGGPVTLPLTTVPATTGAVAVSRRVQAGYTSQIVLVFFYNQPLPATFEVSFRVQYVPILP